MNVGELRHFTDEASAHQYVKNMRYSRVYEIFPDKAPRLCKAPIAERDCKHTWQLYPIARIPGHEWCIKCNTTRPVK